ncbi:hypothetical protein ABGB79_004837 [Salmonella enterica subsp. enterica]
MARRAKKTDADAATNDPGVTLPGNAVGSGLPGAAGRVTEAKGGDDVMVQPVRYFTDSATGVFRTPSDEPFSVNRRRAAELSAGGLAREVKPQPDNKMRPDPQTKE